LEDFRFGLHPFALLLLLDLVLEISADWLLKQPEPRFNSEALPIYSFELTAFLLSAYCISLMLRSGEALLQLCVILYSFGPITIMTNKLVEGRLENAEGTELWIAHGLSIYIIAVLIRGIYLSTERKKLITAFGFLLILVVSGIIQVNFKEQSAFWYAADSEDPQEEDEYAEFRKLDAEGLLYRQPGILERELGKIAKQRPNTSDIFFIGFAAYAHQEVFAKEVAYAKALFDTRFDTAGHSLNLINNLRTIDTTPLATATNLGQTLKHIGRLMDKEEDVLVLYLTSHGSKEDGVSVSFWPMGLNDIGPDRLNKMLDEAGIKWRVVIVSACYSGNFAKALQGPTTLIATAAAEDRTSFGCGNEFDFTYFGEAIFKDQLQQQYSFITALQQAETAIGEREEREKLTPSLPQLSVGPDIAKKLQGLSDELERHHCEGEKPAKPNC
jgi:hypothetical protein